MRWVSVGSDEFAFLSLGGTAKGVIAIGGVAYGVVAIGGVLSIGVISIGMNAVGSVAAFGMNAVAPISLSLINGVGIYTLAGVNGWGSWSTAGVNSTGLVADGGVNTGRSVFPALFVIALLIVGSSVARGARKPRKRDTAVRLRSFLRADELGDARVQATLVAIRGDSIELADGDERTLAPADPRVIASALALAGRAVVAQLARVEDAIPDGQPTNYRERPRTTLRAVVRCLDIAPAPEREGWLPANADEVLWVIAWSARIAAVASIAALAILVAR